MRNFRFLFLINIFFLVSSEGNKQVKNNLKKTIKHLQSSNNSDGLLIGIDKYSQSDKNISFNIVVLYDNDEEAKDNIKIPSKVFFNDGTKSNEIEVNCKNSSILNEITKYSCTFIADSNNTSKVQFNADQTNYKLSTQAQAVKNDISKENSNIISNREINILDGAEIVQKNPKNVVIRGNKNGFPDKYIPESKNIQLITYGNNMKQLYSCEGKWDTDKKDDDYYYLECQPNSAINTDLNNAYGYYANYADQGLLIKFSNPNSTKLEYYRENYRIKTSSGMSTGGIIAIIIPTIIILLAVVGLVMAMRSKTPPPPLKGLNNNSVGVIGIGSSQSVVQQ